MFSSFNGISYIKSMENKNLDKVTIEYANNHPFDGDQIELYNECHNGKIAAFKAGANWQYKQPITEEQFKQYVLRELDSCGYFMADLDADLIQKINPDWKPYSSKSFGEMLLDFACQWNMEHGGKDYEYRLKV